MVKAPIDQNKVLGANYLTEFFLEVKALTEQYANYKNIYLEIEYLTKQEDAKIDTDQLANSKIAINNIRFISNKVYVHFRTLCKILELDSEMVTPIISAYEKINNPAKALPDASDVEDFVIGVNTLLAKDIINNLLQTSQDILNNLYGDK